MDRSILEKKYKASRFNLLFLIILTVVNVITIALFDYFFYISLSFPRIIHISVDYLIINEGLVLEPINYIIIFIIMFIPIVLLLLCYLFSSKNRYKVFVFAIIIFSIDTVLCFLAFNFIDFIFHIYMLVLLIMGYTNGKKLVIYLNENPEIKNNVIEDFTLPDELILENSPGLRLDAPKGRVLGKAEYKGLNIVVKRRRALSELIVNNKVYDEKKGFIETKYQLNALVNSVEINFVFDGSTMFIYADNNLLFKKIRIF